MLSLVLFGGIQTGFIMNPGGKVLEVFIHVWLLNGIAHYVIHTTIKQAH